MAAKGEKSLRKWGKNVGDFQNFVGVFSENVGLFQNFVGDFPKNVGDFSANVGVFGRDGGENSPQVGQRWENRWKDAPHLMLLSRPSGATFTPIWCCFHAHLVQPSHPSGAAFTPIWCNLRPKEGRINKPSALGLVGKICIFAATSYRCGAHTIALSRVPRKALLTRCSLCPPLIHRWASTTSIYTLP